MNRSLLILLFVLVSLHTFGQNNIVYLRYAKNCSDNSNIIDSLEAICNRSKDCVLYYYQKSYCGKESIDKLIKGKGFLSIPNEAFNDEIIRFCEEFSIILGEKVSCQSNRLHIDGSLDGQYSVTFVMNDQDDFKELCKVINVSDLPGRNITLRFLIYDASGKIELLDYYDLLKKQNISFLLNF